MPISTTHGLVGGLLGSGFIAVGTDFQFFQIGGYFLLPLIVSPVVALVISLIAYLIFRKSESFPGITKETCFCIVDECGVSSYKAFNSEAIVIDTDVHKKIIMGTNQECITKYNGNIFGFSAQSILDYAHYLSSGL